VNCLKNSSNKRNFHQTDLTTSEIFTRRIWPLYFCSKFCLYLKIQEATLRTWKAISYSTAPYKRTGDISVSPIHEKKICRPSSFFREFPMFWTKKLSPFLSRRSCPAPKLIARPVFRLSFYTGDINKLYGKYIPISIIIRGCPRITITKNPKNDPSWPSFNPN